MEKIITNQDLKIETNENLLDIKKFSYVKQVNKKSFLDTYVKKPQAQTVKSPEKIENSTRTYMNYTIPLIKPLSNSYIKNIEKII